MGILREDITDASKWVAEALASSGYKADFTPQRLWEIDRFFNEQSQNGEPVPKGLLSENLGSKIFAIGSYIGEVIRLAKGAEWRTDDSDSKGEINIELELPDSTKCWPVQRVMKRFKNGFEDSIGAYG